MTIEMLALLCGVGLVALLLVVALVVEWRATEGDVVTFFGVSWFTVIAGGFTVFTVMCLLAKAGF